MAKKTTTVKKGTAASAAATTKKVSTKVPYKTRSPLVEAILLALDKRRWTTRQELVEAVGDKISKEDAIKVYNFRVHQNDQRKIDAAAEKVTARVARGRLIQVMLSCITLNQHGKIEQKGKGETKAYRLKSASAK